MKTYIICLPNYKAMIYGISSLTIQAKSKKQAEKIANEYLQHLFNTNN